MEELPIEWEIIHRRHQYFAVTKEGGHTIVCLGRGGKKNSNPRMNKFVVCQIRKYARQLEEKEVGPYNARL